MRAILLFWLFSRETYSIIARMETAAFVTRFLKFFVTALERRIRIKIESYPASREGAKAILYLSVCL